MGEENILAWSEPFIEEHPRQHRCPNVPNIFFQVNSAQIARLLEQRVQTAGSEASDIFPFGMFPQTHNVKSLTILKGGGVKKSREKE